MPPKEVARLWDRARRKFRLEDDAVYEDDDAESWVEEEGFTQTLMHWEPPSRRRRRRWWNQPRVRDLGIEREAAMYELLAAAFGEPEPKKKSKKKSKRKQSKRAKPAERRTIRT